jgi:hypothetical protein
MPRGTFILLTTSFGREAATSSLKKLGEKSASDD